MTLIQRHQFRSCPTHDFIYDTSLDASAALFPLHIGCGVNTVNKVNHISLYSLRLSTASPFRILVSNG
ncbi:MAG: hypothetical protein GX811_03760 [Lentisphaerae bacterium]|nr:hypothetical protein [Lentisphaerota bacterium]